MKPNPKHRGDPLFLPEVLRAFGVKVQEWDGWKDRGHGDFGVIQGVFAHHTGTDKDIPGYIANHPELGLCSQIHLNRDGTAVIVGAGIAWHAGRGSIKGGLQTTQTKWLSVLRRRRLVQARGHRCSLMLITGVVLLFCGISGSQQPHKRS